MREKARSAALPVIGGSSLLVIFAVLCLTVFALLSLASVQAYGRLSDASAAAVSAYYEADCRAEALFARIRSGELPEEVEKTGDVYAYACPISPSQTLEVELQQRSGTWTVLRWQAVATTEEVDDAPAVWDGGTIG